MEKLKAMQEDVEQAIGREENRTAASHSRRQEADEPAPETVRERLNHLLHSRKFQIGVIVLVVLDCLMVIAVLLFDLQIVKVHDDHSFVPKIFHYTSVGILCLFLIEISMRLYVLRLTFFKHKLEVFDALVVVISFVLDIVFRDSEDATTGTGLLILLRLWRVTRIVNGIILSVKKQAEEELEGERHLREICEQNIEKYKDYSKALEDELAKLHDVIKLRGIHVDTGKRPKLELTPMPTHAGQ